MNKITELALAAAFSALSFTVACAAAPVAKIGNQFVRPGSQKGKIAIIDTQTRVAQDDFAPILDIMRRETKLNIAYEKAKAADSASLRAASHADVAVIITDDPNTPALLVAPEDFWAVMNVAKIRRERCGKELVRAFSLACGGGGSQFPGNVMNCARPESLDALAFIGFPMDRREVYWRFLAEIGVTPAQLVTYEQACEEGWAPKPENKEQQAIWDEVHKLPTAPIRIERESEKAGK